MGLGFWSNLDTAGQTSAATFKSEEQAREHISGWDENNNPDDYGYAEVMNAHEHYATVEEMRAAGLSDMLGEFLVNVPTFGHA